MTKEKSLDLAIGKIEEDIKHNIDLRDEDTNMCYFKVGSNLTCEECGNCFRNNPNWLQDIEEEIKSLENAKDILESIKKEIEE